MEGEEVKFISVNSFFKKSIWKGEKYYGIKRGQNDTKIYFCLESLMKFTDREKYQESIRDWESKGYISSIEIRKSESDLWVCIEDW